MKLKTLTAIVFSSAIIVSCSPEKTTKEIEIEEGELHFEKKTRFINLIVGNTNYDIGLRLERYDGETEYYTGKAESGEYLLEKVTITYPGGKDEYTIQSIPQEYFRKFNTYIQKARGD